MNEIERFKKGRRIVKALDGIKTERRTPGGQIIYETEDRGEGFFTKLGRWLTTPLTTGTTPGGQTYSLAGSASNFDASKWQSSNGTRQRTPEEEAKLKDPKIQAYLQRQQKEAEARTAARLNVAVSNKSGRGVRPDYTAKFNGMNFTDEEKKYMTDAGFDPTNAKSVQEFILSKASNANLGARKGVGIADGYWGDKSAAAFQALRNQGIFTPKVDAQESIKPVNETPIDAPDPFGYESKGNYSLDNAKTLKTDGIRDWTTMMNYIKGNQNSAFSQDMMHRFGSDLSKWNQKDVESVMGVSGHYGRNDRSRIQGFMAGNLANWNNQRQTAINDYAKKTFLKNQAGMNTLGDAGAGTMAQLDVNNMSERLKFAMGV